mgnify:CR=1 FL=1
MFYDVQPTPNKRIYELEKGLANLEERFNFWIGDFKQKLDIKTLQICTPGDDDEG